MLKKIILGVIPLIELKYYSKEGYEKEYGKITRKLIQNNSNLIPYERETSITMDDDEDMAIVSCSQKAIMKYLLLDNNNFKVDDEDGLAVKKGKIVGIKGTISKKCFRFTKNERKCFGRLV